MIREHEQSSYAYFERLRQKARDEVVRGNLQSAAELCGRTLAWAEKHGERETRDREFCNNAGILIAQRRGDDVISELRRILLGNSNPEICYHAAYNISRFHELRNESRRGLFYNRLCLDHAERTRQPEPLARGLNQLGCLLALDSYFEVAVDAFASALRLLDAVKGNDKTAVLSNLGGAQIMLGRLTPGFSNLFRSLRMARRQGAMTWEVFPCLGLSFAYLEIDRPDRARVHASRALLLAEQAQMLAEVKPALYLLGESEKLRGNRDLAHTHFTRLQQKFYPDELEVPEVLMATDVRKLVNLMA